MQRPPQQIARGREFHDLAGVHHGHAVGHVADNPEVVRDQEDCHAEALLEVEQQRVMIAMALASEPKLLVADEPTTALDVTIQAQILELLLDLKQRLGMSILLITHSLGIVGDIADRVAVMYAGQLVELAPAKELLRRPLHPYTQALMNSVPRLGAETQRLRAIPGHVPQLAALPSA